jgi:hypothetical protein
MRRAAAVVLLAAVLGGCATWSWWPFRPAAVLLARADRAAEELRYREALGLYDEFLARFSEDAAAPRALESRDTVAAIVTTRDELARLRDEVRAREAEVTRLRAELARLRADLEKIKQLDLRLERRR